MAANTVLNYLPRQSVVHKMTGTTKLAFFLLFTFASMITYNTWVLLGLMAVSFAAFKLSHIKLREVRFMLIFMLVFLLLNNLFIFLFDPNQMISKTMIFEEVALALQGSDMTQEQIRQRVEDTLKVCGLYPFRNWPISALSFGQKKRVTIASVLVQQPELIILDEPTAGQDFRHYTDIMEFLRGLNEQGVTVVMITHDMHLMLEYTPRALVFCDGQLIADRSAAAVLCDPELIEQAALKETSLFTLANRCGIAPAEDFVERFIYEDREVRTHGC